MKLVGYTKKNEVGGRRYLPDVEQRVLLRLP